MGVIALTGVLGACSEGETIVDPTFIPHYQISSTAAAQTFFLSPVRVPDEPYILGFDATEIAPRFDDGKAWRVFPSFNTPGIEDVFHINSLDNIMGLPNILSVLDNGVFNSVEFAEYPPDPELSVWRIERQPSGLCRISNLQLGDELVLTASSATPTAEFSIAPFNDNDIQEWRFDKVGELATDLDQRCNGIPSR